MIELMSSARIPLRAPLSAFKWIVLTLVLGAASMAAAGTRFTSTLDTAYIRKNYIEGEFSKVIDSLEGWRKAGSKGSHSDSVFAYRHLGIVYASYETARVRAESYLNLLLRLEPRTEVLDPYISHEVEAFWDKVKIRNKKELELPYASGPPSSRQSKPRIEPASTGGFPWFWVTTGTVLAGGAVAAYLLTQEPSPSGPSSPDVAALDTARIQIRVRDQP